MIENGRTEAKQLVFRFSQKQQEERFALAQLDFKDALA
jgi:hypothetical protein